MGFFSNLFGKQTCCLCGTECGPLKRDKIKDKQYICSDCTRKCSEYVKLSELDKNAVEDHIRFMEKREKIYQDLLQNSKCSALPSTVREKGIRFYDDYGFLVIAANKNTKNKVNHEVIRYDEVMSYEMYTEMNKPTEQGKPETFKEDGIILKLVAPNPNMGAADSSNKNQHPYPWNTRDIKLCFRKSEKDTNYADNAIQHFDWIFGVHDSSKGLFNFGMSKEEKRDLQAKTDMAKLMGGVMKAAIKGEDPEGNEKLMEQMEQAQKSADDASSSGLAVYSRKADEAENQVN